MHLADCTVLLPRLPSSSIDLVFADPPYNLQLKQDLFRPDFSHVEGVTDAWDRFDDFAAYDSFCRKWLTECRRILKPSGAIWVIGTYHNIHRIGAMMQDLGFWLLGEIAWVKTNPMPNFRGVRFTNAHETLLWAKPSQHSSGTTFNYRRMKELNGGVQMRSDWKLPICTGAERLKRNGKKVHSTQKPEALLERVILSTTKPGDIVLDPFFGTGTTGAVAKRLGRRWIGIEKEPLYHEAATERILGIQTGFDFHEEADEEPRAQTRVPFAKLVQEGYLAIGTRLWFKRSPLLQAEVLADGNLKMGEVVGSIHRVGAVAGGTPSCNGWEHWYLPRDDAEPMPLDEFRRRWRHAHEEESDIPDRR